MQTVDPSEAMRLAYQRATQFEQTGEIDPSDFVSEFIAEMTEVFSVSSVDRDGYLKTVRGQARISAGASGISGARKAFFDQLVEQIDPLITLG